MKKLLLLAVFLAAGVYGANEIWQRISVCDPTIRADLPSPNGLKRAVVYGMECGATVGSNTQIAFIAAGQTFRPERTPPFFVVDGEHAISIAWEGNDTFIVNLPNPMPRIYKQEAASGSIDILYR
jgi:hypothetical protein